MSDHPNAFRTRAPLRADISHAPQHVKDAFDKALEWREGELPCQVTTNSTRAGTIPNARIFVATSLVRPRPEMVQMRVLDYRGHDAIAQIDIDLEELPALLQHLIGIYKQKGGRLRPLLEAYQGKDSTHVE